MLRLLRLCLATLLIGLTLAACTMSSDKPLVTADEGATPLPDAFTLFPYEAKDGGFVRSDESPATFHLDGTRYVSTDMPGMKGSLSIRLLPLDSHYLLAVTDSEAPGMIYGFADYADGVLALYLSPDKDTTAALKHERAHAMPKGRAALGGVTSAAQTDAITLKDRRALDYLADMFAAKRLPMGSPAVAYIDEDPDATLPSRLVQGGESWIKVP